MTRFVIYIITLFTFLAVRAQDVDDLLNISDEPQYAQAVFKATRILNGHSVKQTAPGELDFRISHRFGELSDGAYGLYGLDEAFIHFSFEYGALPWLVIGAGRSNVEKTYDGFAKFRLMRQSKGKKSFPVFINYLTSLETKSVKQDIENFEFKHRLAYTHQLMIARKFNDALSLQVNPTFVHKNLVPNESFSNDILALGVGGRLKLTKKVSLNAEYFYVNRGDIQSDTKYYDPLAIGIDIETGGHVFQIMLSNNLAMREAGFITETTGSWLDGDIHLGFNISRTFNIVNY